jgi:hypothetical protein
MQQGQPRVNKLARLMHTESYDGKAPTSPHNIDLLLLVLLSCWHHLYAQLAGSTMCSLSCQPALKNCVSLLLQVWPGAAVYPDYLAAPNITSWLQRQLTTFYNQAPFDGM